MPTSNDRAVSPRLNPAAATTAGLSVRQAAAFFQKARVPPLELPFPCMRTPTDATPTLIDFEKRHKNGEAGALLGAAAGAVAGLRYLTFLDECFEKRTVAFASHDPHAIDMAHALWATGTCVSAIDRCAAALARALCGYGKHNEVDARELWSKRRARGEKTHHSANCCQSPQSSGSTECAMTTSTGIWSRLDIGLSTRDSQGTSRW